MSDANSTLRFCPKCQVATARNTQGACKPCGAAYHALYRAANADKLKAYSDAYRAANAGKLGAYNDAYYAANVDKFKAYIVAYHAANPEVRRINQQNRRARKRANGGTLSKGLAAKLFDSQRGLCACCKDPLGEDYHLDHIMPIVLGGANTDDNIQLLRASCNRQKSGRHPDEFMQEREFALRWER